MLRARLPALLGGVPASHPPFVGSTQVGGAFLLMRQAVQLARVAQQTLPSTGAKAARLVLSLFFKAVLGIERIFHFESIKDVGLALLTGGKHVLRRETLGALLRAVVPAEMAAFRRRTEPQLPRRTVQEVSLDPHGLARFTAKFAIPKGFHTLRNKYMRLEKLTYSFCLKTRMLLSLVAGPGDQSLLATIQTLLQRLLPRLGGAELRLYLDAEAAKSLKELKKFSFLKNQTSSWSRVIPMQS